MPSMDKVKPDSLSKWLTTYKGPYVVSAKLDGVSALFVQNTEGNKLYTRGNGSVGQDISHLIPYIKTLPSSTVSEDRVVRGELIIRDSDFEEQFSKDKANARNMVSGLVTRKTVQKTAMEYVHFVVYEVSYLYMQLVQFIQHFKFPIFRMQILDNKMRFVPQKQSTNVSPPRFIVIFRATSLRIFVPADCKHFDGRFYTIARLL